MWEPERGGPPSTPSTGLPTGLLAGAGFVVIVAATVVAAIAFGLHEAVGRLALLAVAVGGFAVIIGDLIASMVTAAIAWLFLNGFLIDQHAELRWHGTVDLVRLAVLVGAALAGSAYAWLHRMAEGMPGPVPAIQDRHGQRRIRPPTSKQAPPSSAAWARSPVGQTRTG